MEYGPAVCHYCCDHSHDKFSISINPSLSIRHTSLTSADCKAPGCSSTCPQLVSALAVPASNQCNPTYHWSSSTVSLTISTTVPQISGTVHASQRLFYHPVDSTSSTAFRSMKDYIELSLLTVSSSNLRRSLSASASCALTVALDGGSWLRSCQRC